MNYPLDKALGMCLGLHAGDSLGSTLEFGPPRDRDAFRTEITGGGYYRWPAGAATDDTDLMICVLSSLDEHGALNTQHLSEQFLAWFQNGPVDVGNTTRSSLERLIQGVSPRESGATEENSQGNGSLMRCAPMALYCRKENLKQVAYTQSAITHAHPVCQICDYLFLYSLQLALVETDKKDIYRAVLELSRELSEDVYRAILRVPLTPWKRLSTTGYVVHTLTAAFWGLMHTDNFETALLEVVNRGDDSDTAGAVTGALCGAYYGVQHIPEKWLGLLQRRLEIKALLKKKAGGRE